MTGRGGKTPVTRKQWSVEHLGQRNVDSVVGGKIVPQFPDARQQEVMRISVQPKVGEVGQRRAAALAIDIAVGRVSAYHLCDFDINQMRRVQRQCGVE